MCTNVILTTANFLFQWIEVWVELWVNTYIVKMKDTFSLGILPSLIHYTLQIAKMRIFYLYLILELFPFVICKVISTICTTAMHMREMAVKKKL